jgi:RND family efflux transporter MFP subunit
MKTENHPTPTLNLTIDNNRPRTSRRNRFFVILCVVIALVIGLVAGILPRVRAGQKLATASQEVVHQSVNVTNVNRLQKPVELTLPGDVHAYEETEIFARADGYLLKWHTDIGTKVSAGQLLAEIDTPELDQELNHARAALAQAQANLKLARSSAERWVALLKDRAVSQQEVDEKDGSLAAREADVNAAKSMVLRLEKLTNFKEVRAPFAGTITRRTANTGDLIHAGGSGAASALFHLAQAETLRVHVNVPQAYLRDISTGSPVHVLVAEYPNRNFEGKVIRTSGAFDVTTRTLLTEVEVPNADGALFPGIHVDVQLSLAQGNPPIVVPATSIITRKDGLQVAVVDDANAIHLQKVQVGRDLGQTIEIVGGLNEGSRVVTNPSDTLTDGTQVKVTGTDSSNKVTAQIAKR